VFENIKPIDPVAQRRRRQLITAVAFTVMIAGYLSYEFWNYREEQQVRRFFEALQRQDFQGAYQIWQPTSAYSFQDFQQDWGPNGHELGKPVTQFHVTGSTSRGSGVIVRVLVNDEEKSLWVERKDTSLSFPP